MTDSMYDSEKDLPLHKGHPYRLCSDVFRMATMSKGACVLICIDVSCIYIFFFFTRYAVIIILSENIIQQNTQSTIRSLHNGHCKLNLWIASGSGYRQVIASEQGLEWVAIARLALLVSLPGSSSVAGVFGFDLGLGS